MANRPPSENPSPWLTTLVTPLTVGGGNFRLAPGRHFPMSGPWSSSTVVKIFFCALSCRRNGPRLLQTAEVKERPSLTRAVLQTVNILFHWISVALATVQAGLVFAPYRTHNILPIKSNKRRPGLNESTPLTSCNLKNGLRRFVPRIIRDNNLF